MYSGELLPVNQSDTWFFQRSNHYKKMFLKTVEELEKFFLEKRDSAARLELYSRAAAIYPYENWQEKQIRCNLEMYRYEEALKIYHDTLELYAREIGSEPSAELYECFERMELMEKEHKSSMGDPHGWKRLDKAFLGKRENIRKMLFYEENREGAYYCTYPSFMDYCHLIARAEDRNKVEAVLMFLTLSQNEKRALRDQINLQEEMDKLKSAAGKTLRMGDAYTRYGNRHFILMLSGTTMDHCGTIFRRIERAYEQCGGKGELWYYADMTQELGRAAE